MRNPNSTVGRAKPYHHHPPLQSLAPSACGTVRSVARLTRLAPGRETSRAEAAELATFAGLRDAAPEFTAAAAEDAFAEFLCPSVQRFSSAGELLEGLGCARRSPHPSSLSLSRGGCVSWAHRRALQHVNHASGPGCGCSTDRLKAELQRINLKCGGTPIERAERLWSTKVRPDRPTADLARC